MKRPLCCLTLVRKFRSSTQPLLVSRRSSVSTGRSLRLFDWAELPYRYNIDRSQDRRQFSQVQTLGEARWGVGSYGDKWARKDQVPAAYEYRLSQLEYREEEIKAYAGPQVDRSTYEKPIRILARPSKESEDVKVSAGIASQSEPDCNTDDEIQDEETGGKINECKDGRSTKGSYAVNEVRKTPERSSEVDGVAKRDTTHEVDHMTTDPLQGQYNYQQDEIKVEDREVYGWSTRLVDSAEAAAIDEEMLQEDIPAATIYYHEGDELFAEDVDHHMAVLPEVTTSTTDITIDDVQVGDPDSRRLADVFTEQEPETDQTPSMLCRRSYIDDISIPATS
uniref:Uncharacterized protein n=1 Tax=Hyaloperonospora arabidopsidis (strain Emoy2) TaxID=559515 RepID=M4BKS0_HYAAE